MQVLHEDMKDMHQSGIINDARMREFDEMCLVQEPKAEYTQKKPVVLEHSTTWITARFRWSWAIAKR